MTGFEQRSGAATLRASCDTTQGERSRKPAMSPPAVKRRPAPVRTTNRTASSASSSAKTAESWSRAGMETRLNLPGTSRVIVATAASRSTRESVVSVTSLSSSRSSRRRIFPDALFGSASTAVLARALEARERRAEAVLVELVGARRPDDDRDDPLAEPLVRRTDHRDLTTPGCAASTSSTSSGWMFSPPETIMSSTRPSSQRSPSSSR